MKVLVAGATGQTGRNIVKQLVQKNISVRALVRNLEQAKTILPPEAELVVGDVLKPETLKTAITDCNALLCATGASPSLDPTGPYQVDFQGTKNLVIWLNNQISSILYLFPLYVYPSFFILLIYFG